VEAQLLVWRAMNKERSLSDRDIYIANPLSEVPQPTKESLAYRIQGEPADGSVEHLDCVDNRDAVVGLGQCGLQLQQASGIPGGHDVWLKRGDEAGFAVAEFGGGFGLDEIVDSRGAAADGRFGDFE
jgi:hypothetical protein